MSRTLKLGFVMGGGVSLGSFSGAALSESIKQQILFAEYESEERDSNGNPVRKPYERVEIDVFSGASAGAVALALMLRVLANPYDKHGVLGFSTPEAFRAHLEQKIMGQFAQAAWRCKTEQPEKYEQLLAAQALQEFQEKIWVYDVDLERLTGTGKHNKNLRGIAGLADRDLVDTLAREYFPFRMLHNRLEKRSLLADRVLFACTLANLTRRYKHSPESTERGGADRRLLKALNDVAVEREHGEVRVFDLHFQPLLPEQAAYLPLRWVQYHAHKELTVAQTDSRQNGYIKTIGSLQHNNAWREMAATAIASAAFPLAFEPVALNRYAYEYAEDWPEELRGRDRFVFTYVDGGMFDNEPIREATRLAAYLDMLRPYERFDRRIVFVDPNVTELEHSFRVAIHGKLSSSRSLWGGEQRTGEKSTAERLLSGVPQLLGALIAEAQSTEMGKIDKALSKFEQRDRMRGFYRHLASHTYDDGFIAELRKEVTDRLDRLRQSMGLPSNTLQIQQEMLRVLREERAFLEPVLGEERQAFEQMQAFVYMPNPSRLPQAGHWVFVLMCVALDCSMDLIGKARDLQIVPIAPFDFYQTSRAGAFPGLLRLPGGGMAGFAGFASFDAGVYETQYGRYCAQRILGELGYLNPAAPPLPLPLPFDYAANFNEALRLRVEQALLKRIKEILPDSLSSVMPFVESRLKEALSGYIKGALQQGKSQSLSCEFRIQVPGDLFGLHSFAGNRQRLEATRIGDGFYVVTQLTYLPDEQRWQGAHVNPQQQLEVDKMRLFDDKSLIAIQLPVLPADHPARLAPHAVFSFDARGLLLLTTSTRQVVEASKWQLQADVVRALDETLWEQDNLKDLLDKI